MISINDLKRDLGSFYGKEGVSLDIPNLEIDDCGFVFISGNSRIETSMLLNVLCGIDKPSSGKVIVGGKDTNSSSFINYYEKSIRYVSENNTFCPNLTVKDNIELAFNYKGKELNEEEMSKVLDDFGLANDAKTFSDEAKYETQLKLSLALINIESPDVVFVKETTEPVSVATSDLFFEGLKKYSKSKLVVIVCNEKKIVDKYADRVITLKDGKIESDVTINRVVSEPIQSRYKAKDITLTKIKTKSILKLLFSDFKYRGSIFALLVFLLIVAFSTMGALSTDWFYDATYAGQTYLQENNSSSLMVQKKYDSVIHTSTSDAKNTRTTGMSKEDIAKLNNNDLGLEFIGVYSPYTYSFSFSQNIPNSRINYFSGLSDCGEEFILRNGFTKLAGRYPINEKEIAISEATLESFKVGQYSENCYRYSNYTNITSAEDIIGRTMKLRLHGYDSYYADLVICGVYKFDDFDYSDYSELERFGSVPSRRANDLYQTSFSGLGYVTTSFIEKYKPYLVKETLEEISLERGVALKYYFIDPASYKEYKSTNHLTSSGIINPYIASDETFAKKADKFILTDIDGALLTEVPTLGKNEAYVHFYSKDMISSMENMAKNNLNRTYYVYDREGTYHAIGKEWVSILIDDDESVGDDIYYDESTLMISPTNSSGKKKVESAIVDDEGKVVYYSKSVYLNNEGTDYTFEKDDTHVVGTDLDFAVVDNSKKDVTLVDLSTFYYDPQTKKIYTMEDPDLPGNPIDRSGLLQFGKYILNSKGEPDERYGNEIPKVGLFVNKNTGDLSFTKKNDDYLFTNRYFKDQDGKITIGYRVYHPYSQNGEIFYTHNLVPFGYCEYNVMVASSSGFLSDKLDVLKSLKRFCNRYKVNADFLDAYVDIDYSDCGGSFTADDIKTIINAYKEYQALNSKNSAALTDPIGLLDYTSGSSKSSDIYIKGFFIADQSKQYSFDERDTFVLNSAWFNSDATFYKMEDTYEVNETTNYNYKAPTEYGFAIAKSNFSDKELKIAYQKNGDDSYYMPMDSAFTSSPEVDSYNEKHVVYFTSVMLACMLAYSIAYIFSIVKTKKRDVSILKRKGVVGLPITLLVVLPVLATVLFTSGISSLISLFVVSRWNVSLKETATYTIMHFSFINFLFLFGIALLVIGLPTLFACLFAGKKKKAK